MKATYLPWELETEILYRVPATSLKQLRFTCKRWYALSIDPFFIKKNLGGKAATQMVLKKYQSVYSFSFDLHGIHNRYDQFIKFTGKLENLKDPGDVKISEIFQCESLLLCTTKDERLVVWNPCTGQTRWIQSSAMYHTCFLGYKNNNKYSFDSYKIFSCSTYLDDQDATVRKFETYDFDSDSWRVLDDDTHSWSIASRGVSLKGDTYWLNSDDEEEPDLINSILVYDFTSESFGRLPLPFQVNNYYDDQEVVVLSVVREEKLAMLHQRLGSLEMKIWVTNNITDEAKDDLSWSVFLVVDLGKLMINNRTKVTSFLVDEENKRAMCCFFHEVLTRIYIVGEDIHKRVYREMKENPSVLDWEPPSLKRSQRPLLFSYVPSFVRIPTRQSNPGGKRKRWQVDSVTYS
ncbi:unnamed protein product [Microthlaspi erraticum]|uniref:F-box domain-containing protein n=1 Tax=Microthlaspi erraticum TaxID=1685480 RepID=A0A6D2KDV7_9BRAS|nr:unnamed protein product [Microthlaspi erraticum]